MESTLVIKVKYGDTLRRFNARVNENELLDLDMDGLRAKILGLFNFPPDADIRLTYIDEDGDVVTLVDDDDLRDVMRQDLKFLRVDVRLNNDKNGKPYANHSGSSTPKRSPRVQTPLSCMNTGIAELLKSVPEPLHDVLSKLSVDLASRAVSSSPMVTELVDCLSKMRQSCLNPALHSQDGTDSNNKTGALEIPTAPSTQTVSNASKDGDTQEVLPKPSSTSKASQKTSIQNVTRGVGAPTTAVPASIDLNLDPPFDSNPSGCTTVDFSPVVHDLPTGDARKEDKIQTVKPTLVAKLRGDARKEGKKQTGKPYFVASSSSALDEIPFSDKSSFFGMPAACNHSVEPLGNECPYLGMAAANDHSTVPFLGMPAANSHSTAHHVRLPRIMKRGHGRNDSMVGMFHRGVQCDGCGAHPITGPRYKSKVKEDYDLCSICFGEMGNEADYIKLDRPIPYWHPRPFKGLHEQKHWAPPPPHVIGSCGIKATRPKLDSRFILDVNVLDNTVMAPSTRFTKIWRMHNSGGVAWSQGLRLVWIGGEKFSHADSVEIEIPVDGVPVDGELDIAVDFTSPELPGRYISYWRMASSSGMKFGQRIWVLIQVDAFTQDPFGDSLKLDLPFPPDCMFMNTNFQPVVDGGFVESHNSTSVLEPKKPVRDQQPVIEEQHKDQELNFPINDNLLVGNGVPSPASPQVPSSVSYPIIDFPEAAPSRPSHPLPEIGKPDSSDSVKDAVEQSLLKELEDMGFKQVDLNKEILRMNEYNLEQSVDDLCGVAEWDPILEELQEMGFCDKEMNRKLLKKNNGSIKRVVMDILTGEKA